MSKDISIIGAGVVDIIVGAVDEKIFSRSSTPTDFIKSSFGGDALNEAIVLSRLGKRVQWLSKVGDDDAGRRILHYAEVNGLSTRNVKVESNLETAVNLVLVESSGERHFLTNPNSNLRKLSAEDILPHIDELSPLVSFASMFVSPLLDIPAMEKIFSRIKDGGRTLSVDTTRPKNGETLKIISPLLPYIDYFFPNETELAALTGSTDVDENISALLSCGVKCVIVTCGNNGAVVANAGERFVIPAYPVEKVIDTTGAGDCFVAGFLWALSEQMPLEDCAKFGAAVASCSVEAVGAVTGITSIAKAFERYKSARD